MGSRMQGIARVHGVSLQQGARVHQEAMRSGRKVVDARRFYPFSDSESPVKRMSVIIPCHSSLVSNFGSVHFAPTRSNSICHREIDL